MASLGVDDYIVKPIEIHDLNVRIKKYLMRMVIKMKNIILLLLLIMATTAFVGEDLRSKDVLVFVNILTLVPIVVIAIDVYKFANF